MAVHDSKMWHSTTWVPGGPVKACIRQQFSMQHRQSHIDHSMTSQPDTYVTDSSNPGPQKPHGKDGQPQISETQHSCDVYWLQSDAGHTHDAKRYSLIWTHDSAVFPTNDVQWIDFGCTEGEPMGSRETLAGCLHCPFL